jgi:hypothetical protein
VAFNFSVAAPADGSSFSNLTALQAVMKEYYGPQEIKRLAYKKNRWLAMMHKEEDWAGLVVPVPTIYANPQGASASFGTALSNQNSSAAVRFIMNWAQDYAVVTVTNLLALASRTDSGAFLKAVQTEMNGGIKTAQNRLGGALFRRSTGTIGVGALNAGVITLQDVNTVTQFEVGQVLVQAATDGGAAVGAGGPTDGADAGATNGYVIAVDRAAGTVTISATRGGAAGNPTSWATATTTSTYRPRGDVNLKINGLPDWLPTTAPGGADSFNNVNRSADPSRLAGIRWNGSAQVIAEALIDAAALAAREEGTPELCITNFQTFAALEKDLGSKVNYVNYEHDEIPGVGFTGIRIHGADEEISVFADRSCPGKLAYLIDPDAWTLGSMKPCPHILTELDGLTELRDPNNDAAQVRVGSYCILACDAPGSNAVVSTAV